MALRSASWSVRAAIVDAEMLGLSTAAASCLDRPDHRAGLVLRWCMLWTSLVQRWPAEEPIREIEMQVPAHGNQRYEGLSRKYCQAS